MPPALMQSHVFDGDTAMFHLLQIMQNEHSAQQANKHYNM